MVAIDGFPFSVFSTSMDLRDALKSRGFAEELPKSRATITKLFTNFAEKIKNHQISEILDMKASGTKFSIIFDEWTSNRNRRYMNVILSAGSKKLFDFGLIRIKGINLIN